MADTKTPFYQLTNPEVGASFDSWGDKENADRTLVDEILGVPRPGFKETTDGTLDLSEGVIFHLNVDGNKTVSFTNVPTAEVDGHDVGTLVWLTVTNGGLHTITWPGSVSWFGSGSAPVLPSDSGAQLLFLTFDEGTNWIGLRLAADINFTDVLGTISPSQLPGGLVTLIGSLGYVAKTDLGDTSFGTVAIPANSLAAGRVVRIKARVTTPNNGTGSQTIKFGSATAWTFDPQAETVSGELFLYDVEITVSRTGTDAQISVAMGLVNDGLTARHFKDTVSLLTQDDGATITVDFRFNGDGATYKLVSATVELITPP